MKPISTASKHVFALFILISLSISGVSQNNQTSNSSGMSFLSTPTLISGNALSIGAKYKFTNVYPGTSAVVTIVSSVGGATVEMLDDNNLTKPEAFSPRINVPANSNGLVEFKIEFFQGNGNTNNPKTIDTLRLTPMDIDGNDLLHEVDAVDMGLGSVLSYYTNTLEIDIVQTGNEYKATNIGGHEYDGVDTAAKQVMFTLMNTNINHFTYKVGANNADCNSVTRQKGNYFKGFNYNLNVLAVKYYSFNATANGKSVLLNWITESEINHKHFELERSFDSRNFSTIGIISKSINNSTKNQYAFNDESGLLFNQSVIYYRLKQVDVDGKFTYSTILSVHLKMNADVQMQVSPNPFIEAITTRFVATENGKAEIRIMNVRGQIVTQKTININKGFNNIQLEGLSALPSGVFIANLIVDGKSIASQQIIK